MYGLDFGKKRYRVVAMTRLQLIQLHTALQRALRKAYTEAELYELDRAVATAEELIRLHDKELELDRRNTRGA